MMGAYATWELRFYFVSYWIAFFIIVLNGYSNITRVGTKCSMNSTFFCRLNTFNRFSAIVFDAFRLIVWSMILYLYHYVSTGKFHLNLNPKSFGSMFEGRDGCFLQIVHIHIYYDKESDLERDRDRYQKIFKNLHFHLDSQSHQLSESVIHDDNLSSIEPLISSPRPTIYIEDEIRPKRSKIVKRNSAGPERPVSSINGVDRRFICPSCQCILREPYQLSCGHRICRSCLHLSTDSFTCVVCSATSKSSEVVMDESFRNELEVSSISCAICDWKGSLLNYQDHLNETHQPKLTTCFICAEQIAEDKLSGHYLTETHQRGLLRILSQISAKTITNDQERDVANTLIQKTLSDVSEHASLMLHRLDQLYYDVKSDEQAVDCWAREFRCSQTVLEENKERACHTRAMQMFTNGEIERTKTQLQNPSRESFDGTLMWKISDIQEKIVDARSERQRSIYSQCFYSSPTGYKMRLRLFLNGTNTGRDTHLSLFFVLMRGEFDALLTWPFGYKVTFCLLEQCSSDDHPRRLSQCFWPDTSLNCFQRPQSDMNEAYGIEKLIPLEQLRADHPSRYMENDTIFIQAEVDFESRRPTFESDSGTRLFDDESHIDTNEDDAMRYFSTMTETWNRTH